MPKTKISEFSSTPGNNTDIDGINIAEGCAPSGINDAIRELMSQLKDWQSGTSNDPMVIGSSGSLTLSYGTANGVAYLNGSKVLTTGSALTFDGTNFATTGSVTSAGANNSGNLAFTGTGNRITGDFSNATIANRVMFQTSMANSSSAVSVLPSGTNSTSAFQTYNNSDPTNASLGSLIVDSGALSLQSTIRGTGTYLPMTLWTGGSERMRLDTSGNLGIGTSSPAVKLDVAGTKTLASDLGVTNIRDTASLATGNGGAIVLMGKYNSSGSYVGGAYVNASKENATDGNYSYALTFGTNVNGGAMTERMRLDSSGQLGVGFTPLSTQGNLQVYKNISGGAPATSGTTDANQVFAVNYSSVQTSFGAYANGAAWIQQRAGGNFAVNYDLVLQPNGGNVGIGTSSPTNISGYTSLALNNGTNGSLIDLRAGGTLYSRWVATSSQAAISTEAAIPLVFQTNSTERARITSGGTLLIGRTADVSATTRLGLDATASIAGFVSETGPTTSVTHGRFINGNGTVGSISTNGTATTYSTSSDYRLKEDVQPMTGALAKVAALKPCTYKWKVDGSDGEGFIAHELAEVVPQCVVGEKDAVDADGNPQYQGIDTSFLVATLTAAIQEQQAIINQLTARIEALEQA